MCVVNGDFMIKKIYERINSNRVYFICFMIVLTLLSSINIFHSGIIINHDINFHLHRILAISDNIRIGKITPVYFNYLNGLGYGNGLFYPDIFLYFPAFLKHIGFTLEFSYKVFILLINFVSIYTMYLCVKKITMSNKCAYVSMTLYSFSIYRLIDLVDRGALGETIAFAFIPLVVLGLYEILYGNYKNGFYLTIGLSGVCFSHVISFYLTCILIILVVIVNLKCLKNLKRFISLLTNIFLSIVITCFFWAPLLEQIIFGKFNFDACQPIFETLVPLYLLFIDYPVVQTSKVWYPSGIGLIYYYGIVVFLKRLVCNKFKCDNRFLFTLFFLSIIFILVTCCSFIWKIDIFYKSLKFIQFPWRFNIISTVLLTIAFGIMMNDIRFNTVVKTFLIYTIVIFFTNVVLYSFNVYSKSVLKDEIMMGEYLPKYFDFNVVDNYSNKYIEYEKKDDILNVSLKKWKNEIEVPLIYYKGYVACGDKCYPVFKTKNGLVGIRIDKDATNFKVWYKGTNLYNVTKYISFLGIIILIYKIKKCK